MCVCVCVGGGGGGGGGDFVFIIDGFRGGAEGAAAPLFSTTNTTILL